MDHKEQAEYIATIACKAVRIPQEDIMIEGMPLKIKILLQDDTLLPVIIAITNILGDNLLASRNYETIHPFDLQKTEESLCYVKIVENNKKCAPMTDRILITMETVTSIFVPSFDNKIDLTGLVKTWREVLAPLQNGQTIDINKFHNELIMHNLDYLIKNNPNSKLNKSK
jgi:hypothetical protein